MLLGNYDLLTEQVHESSWAWGISDCVPEKTPDCIDSQRDIATEVLLRVRRKARIWPTAATRWSSMYPMACAAPSANMPTRDTYSWDAVSLAGTIDSVYDVGCFNGPPGSQFWTFALQRL